MSMAPGGRNILESLKSLGLTKYEAMVYTGLMTVPGATATEIHEASGVPRASVYPVLDRLLQKNLVSVSNSTPKRFNAVPPEQGIHIMMAGIETSAQDAREQLDMLFHSRQAIEGGQELIWSVYGGERLSDRIVDLIRESKHSIRVIEYGRFTEGRIKDELLARAGGVSIEMVTSAGERLPLPGVYHYTMSMPEDLETTRDKNFSGGVFIFDSSRVMVVIGAAREGFTGLYSESIGFFRFFSSYCDILRDQSKRLTPL